MRVLGWSEDVSECECGKTGLKKTCAVEMDGGTIKHYGTTCITLKFGNTQGRKMLHLADIKKAVNAAKHQPIKIARHFGCHVNHNGWIVFFGEKIRFMGFPVKRDDQVVSQVAHAFESKNEDAIKGGKTFTLHQMTTQMPGIIAYLIASQDIDPGNLDAGKLATRAGGRSWMRQKIRLGESIFG